MGFFSSKEEDRAQELQDIHNEGQEDASKGVDCPPNSDPVGIMLRAFASPATAKEMDEERDAYETGHSNTESQKSSGSGGGCFLTTACTQAAGLPDDCHELTVLRRFRDTFVRRMPGGEALIREYYVLSPQIVPKLSDEELQGIFGIVQRAVGQISQGDLEGAFDTYAVMFTSLRDKHLMSE